MCYLRPGVLETLAEELESIRGQLNVVLVNSTELPIEAQACLDAAAFHVQFAKANIPMAREGLRFGEEQRENLEELVKQVNDLDEPEDEEKRQELQRVRKQILELLGDDKDPGEDVFALIEENVNHAKDSLADAIKVLADTGVVERGRLHHYNRRLFEGLPADLRGELTDDFRKELENNADPPGD